MSRQPNPCAPRRRFTSRESVQAAAVRIAASQGQHRLPEACPRCKGWHLARPIGARRHATRK